MKESRYFLLNMLTEKTYSPHIPEPVILKSEVNPVSVVHVKNQ